jgi:uncharacterized RDD family membrane protein YckC
MPYCPNCGSQVDPSAKFCPKCGVQLGAAGGGVRSGLDTLTRDSVAQGYWIERVFAYVIDVVLIWLVIFVLSILVFIPTLITGPFSILSFAGLAAGLGVLSAISGVIVVLYFTVAEALYGRSIGKSLFRLKVVAEGGGLPSLAQSFIRNISKIYWLLLLLDIIVGLALEADYKKKFSDRYARTTVVKA